MDETSFESLFRTYNAGLVVYADRMVRNMGAAEDIVHDVFVRLWTLRHRIELRAIKTYLFNSVRNESLNHLEHLKVRTEYQERVRGDGNPPGLQSWEYYIFSELESHIEKALRSLSPRQRLIFLMSREDHKTSAQIGEELELSPRTVEKHMEIALRRMRDALADYLPLLLILLR